MTAIQVTGVDVTLAGHPILRDVSLAVQPGELVSLVGPNGAGKSTLLGVITGDISVESGSVALFGQDLRDLSRLKAARTRAVQTQQATVSFAFTAEQVVRMGRAPWQASAEAERDDDVVASAMRLTETIEFAVRRLPTLSGGEAARVSFARALAQETAVMLLDEPTAALDLRHQEMELSQMRERADQGVAVVVVLHDLSLAGAYSDRLVLLDGGRVVADGPPKDVLQPEALEAVYRHRVTVIPDPVTGAPVVLPVRGDRRVKAVA